MKMMRNGIKNSTSFPALVRESTAYEGLRGGHSIRVGASKHIFLSEKSVFGAGGSPTLGSFFVAT